MVELVVVELEVVEESNRQKASSVGGNVRDERTRPMYEGSVRVDGVGLGTPTPSFPVLSRREKGGGWRTLFGRQVYTYRRKTIPVLEKSGYR